MKILYIDGLNAMGHFLLVNLCVILKYEAVVAKWCILAQYITKKTKIVTNIKE